MPVAGSDQARLLDETKSQARFAVLYPCQLPASQRLASATVLGAPPRQRVELGFDGPFNMTLRQSQSPPAVDPDPSGTSHIDVELFPNVRGTLIERYDGSSRALYHLFWARDGIFYELQADGPPLQRRTILLVATSLE